MYPQILMCWSEFVIFGGTLDTRRFFGLDNHKETCLYPLLFRKIIRKTGSKSFALASQVSKTEDWTHLQFVNYLDKHFAVSAVTQHSPTCYSYYQKITCLTHPSCHLYLLSMWW
ncbi:uncharacterized protein [Rutidosis leptorrhynchoides]|uniref:uncharacterized protein n=1 Tax=Rutidosis leptorrhynchoides TaxID=125765 RepID=UPI003A98DEBB